MLINNVTAHVMDDELPPVVGVDFDSSAWAIRRQLDRVPKDGLPIATKIRHLTNLIRDDGVSTNFDLII